MKDFYKILGVKEDASEEEIRERWLELTKQYHPDRGEGRSSDERIREINEAYQVLKHSSTRVEYDLKRTYGQEKRKSYAKRVGIPAGILIITTIVGIIYFMNFWEGASDSSTHPYMTASTETASTLSSPPSSKLIVSNKTASIGQTNQTRPDKFTPWNAKPISPGPEKPDRQERPRKQEANQTDQRDRIGSSTLPPREVMNQVTPSVAPAAPPQTPTTPLPIDVVANKPMPSINQIDQRNQINPKNVNIEPAQFKSALLLATEDEVRKFFNNYVHYYNHKNARDILSLFSSKALQNQKDGLEEIRKIYMNFFSEGLEIRYSLHDMKIEIYENAVEVKARYEIEQVSKTTGEKEVWRGPIRWVLIKEDGQLKIVTLDYKYHRPSFGKEESVE